MSSEAITQNDLREILSRTVGSIPSEYKKLLWTNPSPTSPMSGGTTIVASGADEYDAIEVEYKTAHIYDGYETASAPFVSGAHITLLAPTGGTGEFTGTVYNAVRTISMSTGGVLIADGAVVMGINGTSTNNNMCIPYKVYGIKYERVAPPQLEVPQKIELLRVSSGLANTDYTLADNISNYDIISFVALSGYSNRWGTMIPTSVFAESTNTYYFTLGSEPNVYNIGLHYTNNTKITVVGHGTGTTGLVVTAFKL